MIAELGTFPKRYYKEQNWKKIEFNKSIVYEDLRGKTIENCTFDSCRFELDPALIKDKGYSNICLSELIFKDCYFIDCTFSQAYINCIFLGSTISKSKFNACTLYKTTFVDSIIRMSEFSSCKLIETTTYFSSTVLQLSDFIDCAISAKFFNTSIQNTKFKNCKITNISLKKVVLSSCDLTGVSFTKPEYCPQDINVEETYELGLRISEDSSIPMIFISKIISLPTYELEHALHIGKNKASNKVINHTIETSAYNWVHPHSVTEVKKEKHQKKPYIFYTGGLKGAFIRV